MGKGEALWFFLPAFADELVGREPPEGIESSGEIEGGDEVGEVSAK